ncbi:alpha/beta fold hydrolase [Phenylobacterium sp.]|uniref:alpha/beta hydrolase family protein n=1 Tax=Phenylobacterium sp. TaxID=1871053 RepID=UPI00374DD08D
MIRNVQWGAVALGAALLAGQGVRAAEPPLNDSVRQVRDLRDVAISPDGTQVAAVVVASTAEGAQSHVWLLGRDGKAARQMTASTQDDQPGERDVAWSKDGASLLFLAKRGKAARLYRLPMAGGEAASLVLTRPAKGPAVAGWDLKDADGIEAPVTAYEIAPDDRWIAVIATDGETAARAGEVKSKDDAVRVGRDDLKKARLYLVDAASGAAREIDLPDNAEEARWNAASDELLVVTAPDDDDLGPAQRLWRVKAASGAVSEVAGAPRSVRRAAWTADGIAYLAQCEEDAPPGCAELFARNLTTQTTRGLTRGLKGSLTDSYVVEKGGGALVMLIMTGVDQKLARIDLASGAITWVAGPQPVVGGLATNPAQTAWAMGASGPGQPPAVYLAAKLGEAGVKLSAPAMLPAGWPLTPSTRLSWTNAGLKIEGLLYQPTLPAGAKAPLVVVVHGGPSGVFQDRYSNLANLLVAQGWAVLATNPRGSQGYGAAFEAANKNDLGGADYTDIMAGVDTVIAKYAIDPAKMALIGYSYGGEMAGFVEGRTDRFKALVSGAPVIDQFSEYGTEDSSFYDRWYFGKPWERFADAWRQSPLARVGHARTPLLLLQGEDDPTDPLGQSQEMRRAMLQVGAPVVLVTYPRETHRTLGAAFSAQPTREPWHGADLRRRMIGFIADAFAGKPPTEQPSPSPASAAEKAPKAPIPPPRSGEVAGV